MKQRIKRVVWRLLALAVVVVVSAIAIAQAQRSQQDPESTDADGSATTETQVVQGEMTPIPVVPEEPTQPATASPYAQSRVLPSHDEMYAPTRWEPPPARLVEADAARPATVIPTAAEQALDADQAVSPADAVEQYPPAAVRTNPFRSAGTTVAQQPPPVAADDGYAPMETAPPPLLEESGQPQPAYDPTPVPAADTAPPPSSAYGGEYDEAGLAAEPPADDRFVGQAAETDDTFRQDAAIEQYSPQSSPTPLPRRELSDSGAVLESRIQSLESPVPVDPRPLSASAGLGTSSGVAGTGRPGPKDMDGPQTPTLTLEKIAPAEIQVGKPATCQLRVRNVGQVAASKVMLRDELPQGARLIDSSPPATQTSDNALYWEVGTLEPGEEATVSVQLMPLTEGQIGSVATVSLQASATARSTSTKPELTIEHSAPRQVLIGQEVKFSIKLANPGTGVATQVFLEEDVPAGLKHSAGHELEYEVGTIQPGDTRHLELTLTAAQPGIVDNVLVARGNGNLVAEDRLQLEVIAPQLEVALEGPKRRYLNRPATFSVSVANPGTAPSHNVELTASLPSGLKFVNTNNAGQYDARAHAVSWSLEQLPPGEMGRVQFTALPTEMGQHKIRAEAKADMSLADSRESYLVVEGLAALLTSVVDLTDPIEVGGQTSYEVRVVNQGSKTATNLRLAALIPPGLKAINGEGPTRASVEGQRIVFDSLARLAPKAEATYKVHVQGVQAGDQRMRVQVISDEISAPVTKEESTHVYSDE